MVASNKIAVRKSREKFISLHGKVAYLERAAGYDRKRYATPARRAYERTRKQTPKAKATTTRWRRRQAGIPDPPYPAPEHCESCQKAKKLVIDHDHVTGTFRGWLCHTCNLSLGQLGDSIAGVEALLRYLKKSG